MHSPAIAEPPLSDDITASSLDAEARRDLRGLQKETAETVARHLVAAGRLVDEDPEQALEHARYARRRASRIAVVREAAGIVAYHAGEWAEALSDLRAARRMGGGPGHLAVMADIERALGRPERALELARSQEARELDRPAAIELTIVTAGARRDLGELDAAVVGLQIPELDPARRDSWSVRLFYAYADNLLAAGRESDALQWFVHTHDADTLGETDAARRIAELTGEELVGDDVDFDIDDLAAEPVEPDAELSVAIATAGDDTATDDTAGDTGADGDTAPGGTAAPDDAARLDDAAQQGEAAPLGEAAQLGDAAQVDGAEQLRDAPRLDEAAPLGGAAPVDGGARVDGRAQLTAAAGDVTWPAGSAGPDEVVTPGSPDHVGHGDGPVNADDAHRPGSGDAPGTEQDAAGVGPTGDDGVDEQSRSGDGGAVPTGSTEVPAGAGDEVSDAVEEARGAVAPSTADPAGATVPEVGDAAPADVDATDGDGTGDEATGADAPDVAAGPGSDPAQEEPGR